MKKIAVLLLLLVFFVGMLAAGRNIMPIWQWVLPSVLLVGTVYFVWQSFNKISAFLIGIVMTGLLFLLTISFDNKGPLIVSNEQSTYVIYNNCFMYCKPTIYKKYPYIPFTQQHQRLGEQAVLDYMVSGDTIYLKDGIREWLLVK
ncbi:MAG: hypothetical protein ACRBFS_26910 [Aureispira sp.]